MAALKLLPDNFASDPHVRDRFQREAIAMEFLDGKTLKEVVQEGPLETSRLVSIAIQVLDGVEAIRKRVA